MLDKEKVDSTKDKVDEFIADKAKKHNFTRFQVVVGCFIGLLAIVGVFALL